MDNNENNYLHSIMRDFQHDLSGNPRIQILNNLISIIQGNRLNENVSLLPLASNFILPQQSHIGNVLRQSLFEKNLYKNVLSEEGENQVEKVKYKKKCSEQHNCCISFDDFQEDQEVYKLPCGHIFSESIKTWLKEESNKCPVCRFELAHKEIKNKDYLIDISNNLTNRQQIPVNPFGSFLNNMRNIYTNPRPITRQNGTDNLGLSSNMPSVFDDFTYDREYQNAILSSIQEFEQTPTIEEDKEDVENEEENFDHPELWEDTSIENIYSDDDDDDILQVD